MKNRHSQIGMSLVEIMISMVLGLVLLGGTFQIFMVTKNSQKLQNGIADVQENGRYAIHVLRENILMAGFSMTNSVQALEAATTEDGTSDQITVRYESAVDCLGVALPGSAGGVAVNRLFIDLDTQALKCDGNGDENVASVALVEGVENMQVLYGSDDDDNGVSNRYINATEISDWDAIVSVRIALLVRSHGAIGGKETQKFQLLDAPEITRTDAVAHRVFTTTIPLRNSM